MYFPINFISIVLRTISFNEINFTRIQSRVINKLSAHLIGLQVEVDLMYLPFRSPSSPTGERMAQDGRRETPRGS